MEGTALDHTGVRNPSVPRVAQRAITEQYVVALCHSYLGRRLVIHERSFEHRCNISAILMDGGRVRLVTGIAAERIAAARDHGCQPAARGAEHR